MAEQGLQVWARADLGRRIRALSDMLAEITEWGWDNVPTRKLVFRTDHPRKPRPLPRYIPVDAGRRLTAALAVATHRLADDALVGVCGRLARG